MPSIKDITTKKELQCESGTNLLTLLLENNVFVDNACNGKGTCGKCRIRLVEGELEISEEDEAKKLTEKERKEGIHLACLSLVKGDCVIQTNVASKKMNVLTDGYIPEFEKDVCEAGYGVAIDIGTTTIAMSMISMKTGEILSEEAGMNGQRLYGQDVLTRITYEIEQGQEAIDKLKEAVITSINEGIKAMCKELGISTEEVMSITVAGNCTMTHMLLGVDARSIGMAPYKPAFLQAQTVNAKEHGIECNKDATLYCLAQVSGFIGGDILAGAYVCDLLHSDKISLFLDIGTNGEMVVSKRGELYSCSCAAGPALEGMNITCGMPALPGAVEKVWVEDGKLCTATIAGEKPKGICGSGILEVVDELIKQEFIKKSGVFVKKKKIEESDWRYNYLVEDEGGPALKLSEGVLVTQKDVRQVQLAKGAILSGFLSLVKRAGITVEDIDEVIIAGQFGSHLSAQALAGVGIIPREVKEKVTYVGNTSKTGAYMALLSHKVKEEMEDLADKITYYELAEIDGYEQLFMECMRF
ncbi:MAG: ASKHA domain-containing protein [Lachnospiraceae bacterium]|nr:ASKHA domain-containing protein [Lachnospiraceae bacterium]